MAPAPSFTGFDHMSLGSIEDRVRARLEAWRDERLASRIWSRDHTVWSSREVPELTDRLGWLDLPAASSAALDEQLEFADEVVAEGFEAVILLGMGGSSLAPELFQATFGNAPRHPRLQVLDTTHPAAIAAMRRSVPLRSTLFVVSSKSGTTIESTSLLEYFWETISEVSSEPGRQFVAITDPGTPLERLARERRMRRVFLAPADVGGRYSALSVFGTLPGALVGLDLHRLLQRARMMAVASGPGVDEASNPALQLGAVLGEAALAGQDKVTFQTSPAADGLPAWLEQLIAESTGKNGLGIVPVAGEQAGEPSIYGSDRLFVSIVVDEDEPDENPLEALEEAGFPVVTVRLADRYDVGQEIFRWEMATAAAGSILGIQPFDQPDVSLAKDFAREAMAAREKQPPEARKTPVPETTCADASVLASAVIALIGQARPGDYVAIQAYLEPRSETSRALDELRRVLRNRTRLATTAGYGPRFLHSTGQLHKGGPNTGLFLQIVDEPTDDLPIPGTGHTFSQLLRAQAIGDYRALVERGRRILRVNVGRDPGGGLEKLAQVAAGI